MISLRRTIRRVLPAEQGWTYLAPAGETARLEQWIAEVELQLAAEDRRRAWSATDAEWESGRAQAASAPPAASPLPPFIVQVPTPATTRGTLQLLDRLRGGEILLRTPDRGKAGAPDIYVLRPSGRLVRTSVARRAIADALIQPACDGLFGPDTSQTWFLPPTPAGEVMPDGR